MKVLTWHVHGNYLFYLTQAGCEFYLPVNKDRTSGYGGKTKGFPWGNNVHEVDAREVRNLDFDVILFQSKENYLEDQYRILSTEQRELPKIYLEHDPPRETPTETKHIVQNPSVLLVHCTNFNNVMWDSGSAPTKVIEHGVLVPEGVVYKGKKEKGVVVVNNLKQRGRRLGLDIFEKVRKKIPLDLIGINSEELGGLGSIGYRELPEKISEYRFFFNPIRYTSLGLSVCEAMMIGMPIVGLATTEMAVAIRNGYSGYVHTDINVLQQKMKELLENPPLAQKISVRAREAAKEKYSIRRFAGEWEKTLASWAGVKKQIQPLTMGGVV